jgi:hypothetical protein
MNHSETGQAETIPCMLPTSGNYKLEAAVSAAIKEVHGDQAEDLNRRLGLLKRAQDQGEKRPG